jgi:hypothetical protein
MLKEVFKWIKKLFGLDDGGKMDNSLVESAVAVAQTSSGALALIKKIPLFRDYLLYEEGNVMLHKAVNEKLVNEYKILNDPKAQAEFINSFPTEIERNLVAGHILDVQANAQKCLNVVEVLKRFNENIKSTDEKDVDDKQMDSDWWMLWLEWAKMTSTPQKQEILAKALELENKKHGTISARFIRVLGDMSADELAFFQNYAKFFSKDGYLYSHANNNGTGENLYDLELNSLSRLENFSVARFAAGLGEYHFMGPVHNVAQRCFSMNYKDFSIVVWKELERLEISYSMSLTEEGRLLRDFLCPASDLEFLKSVAQKMSRQLKCRVSVHPAHDDRTVSKQALASFMNGVEEPADNVKGLF